MKQRMELPYDLKRYVRGYVCRHVAPCVLLLSALATVAVLWGDSLLRISNVPVKVFVYAVCAILILVICGVPKKLIDRTYLGTIKKVTFFTTVDSRVSFRNKWEDLYRKNIIELAVELPNGKMIYPKVYEGKAKEGQHLETYAEGQKVFHLYGTKTVVILPTSEDTHVACAVCGRMNEVGKDKCSCGYRLVTTEPETRGL